LKKVGDLCPENLSSGMWRQFQDRLEELSQRTRRRMRRHNPLSSCVSCGMMMRRNPGESTATLARRALTKMRQARAKAGFDVFRRRRRNPAPGGGSAWAPHMSTPEALDGPATSLNTSMTEHFLGPM
jgi:hypothetical protein